MSRRNVETKIAVGTKPRVERLVPPCGKRLSWRCDTNSVPTPTYFLPPEFDEIRLETEKIFPGSGKNCRVSPLVTGP
jgi:hypothetical protein